MQVTYDGIRAAGILPSVLCAVLRLTTSGQWDSGIAILPDYFQETAVTVDFGQLIFAVLLSQRSH